MNGRFGFGLLLGLMGSLAGCGGLDPVEITAPGTDATQLFARLIIDARSRVFTLSTVPPYDTLTLTPTAWNLAGDLLPDLPAPTFLSLDSLSVAVTSDGVLHARKTASNVRVIAQIALPGTNVRRADTAYVTVTSLAAPPRLASLSLVPDGTYGTVRTMHTTQGIPDFFSFGMFSFPLYQYTYALDFFGGLTAIDAADSNGNPVSGLAVELLALDTTVAGFSSSSNSVKRSNVGSTTDLYPLNPGSARLVVRTTAYGITAADTLAYQVTWPALAGIKVVSGAGGKPQFTPTNIRVAPSAVINWWNTTSDTMTVTFDDPTNVAALDPDVCQAYTDGVTSFGIGLSPDSHCGPGDVVIPPPGGPGTLDPTDSYGLSDHLAWSAQLRQFPVPGIYTFHLPGGASGTITVTDNPEGTVP